MTETDGFHLVVDALKLNDVETIYGVVGIPITDLARLAQASGIRYVGFRHESTAGHAAAAAGFLTKKPGVLLTVSGPGFLNGMVALANATVNCFPMVHIAGSSDRAIVDLQRGDYEELDQMAAARQFAKASLRIDRAQDIGRGIARALRIASSGRPGGVYLDIPAAVLAETLDSGVADATVWKINDPAPQQFPAQQRVLEAVELLAGARRPLIVLGKGAAYAQADRGIRAFVERTGIPFLPMSMAKGLLPDGHTQSAAAARSLALAKADVVLLVGARLNWLLGHGEAPQWSPEAKFIQVDIDAGEFDSNQPTAVPLAGDIGSVIDMMVDTLDQHRVSCPEDWRAELAEKTRTNDAKMAARLAEDPEPMHFHNAFGAIKDVLAHYPQAYVVNEGANTLDIGRNVLPMTVPRHRLDCGTWGVMGIGLGYAIAAAVESGQPVVAIEGDSAFGFSGMEIETICRYQLPVTVVILNNGGVYRGDDVNPLGAGPAPTVLDARAHHEHLIRAFGGTGYHVRTSADLKSALAESMSSGGPALIDCELDIHVGAESGHLTNLNPKGLPR
ncbi:oxalyl-CoA decarboxylase [Mycobacterium sp. MS1601]|uniref:oxalyl-CoA decarboxylase n=1 Tax=Mycobacterium sp. MS1601 TaxID=1936029 RepID=UPI00097962AD|nr:oxalyl-CoA decarboxylase [Mycobacterium sp. MS1601]AQA03308.1 oxalyl-CoA decarboxylase [Mycobacterium sp. MS1601]